MATQLWIDAYPAQSDDFLQLHYTNTAGQPTGAVTVTYRHPWSDHDYMEFAAEMEIYGELDGGYCVRLIQYSWNVWDLNATTAKFERYHGCSVRVFESHENFGRFFDAEAYALFCWARWRATGSAGAAGMRYRDDLDNMLNPVPQVQAAV